MKLPPGGIGYCYLMSMSAIKTVDPGEYRPVIRLEPHPSPACHVVRDLAMKAQFPSLNLQNRRTLSLTMPVHRVPNGKIILHEYFQIITFIDLDQGTGLLVIDEEDLPGHTICTISVLSWKPTHRESSPNNLPGALVAL